MFKLETAISTWRHQFKYSRNFRDGDIDELERHLRDQVEFLIAEGMSEEAAFREASLESGTLAEADAEYKKIFWRKIIDQRSLSRELLLRVSMLSSYFRLAYRNLLRNKAASFINIAGLSVAIGCTIVVFLFAYGTLHEDRFHENGPNIFLVEQEVDDSEGYQLRGDTPLPLGPALEADFPSIVRTIRVEEANASIQLKDLEWYERIRFVDSEFFEMFTFPLKYGDPEALEEKDAVILNDIVSRRLFGDRNPVGEVLPVTIGDREPIMMTVRGVAEPFPSSTDFRFRLLSGFQSLASIDGGLADDWSRFTLATFIQVEDPSVLSRIETQLQPYLDRQNAATTEWTVLGYRFDNLFDLTRNSGQVHRTIAGSVSWTAILILGTIATFLMLLSCVNYMNISVASVSKRLREIGVRKTMGGNRSQLIFQFLAENVLLCLLALIGGIILARFLFIPGFQEITDVALEMPFFESTEFWLFLVSLLLITGVLSGAYPAVFISSFSPVVIFRGRTELGRKKPFTSAFLTFQFMLTFVTMSVGVVFFMNEGYQQNADLGYEPEHSLIVVANTPEQFRAVGGLAESQSTVQSSAGTVHHMGLSENYIGVEIDGVSLETVHFDVGTGYMQMMGLRLLDGDFLAPTDDEAIYDAVVVNEMLVESAGWESPIGQLITVDSTDYSIAGVVENFHFDDFSDAIEPVFIRLARPDDYRFLLLKTQVGADIETAAILEIGWANYFPDEPFTHLFQDELFDHVYQESRGLTVLFSSVALMAILISCLGLYGLASQNVISRMKEISIRKVLGGSIPNITALVNRRYFVLISIAAILGIPFSLFIVGSLLDELYVYRMPLGPIPFMITFILIFGTSLATVATQMRKIDSANPADVMRAE